MITLEEVLNRYLAGERDFSNINSRVGVLVNINLSGIDLSGATLDRVNLIDCNLSKANLSQANIPGSCLEGINLSQANLSQTNFCVNTSVELFQAMQRAQANLTTSLENQTSEVAAQATNSISEQTSQQLQELILPVSLKKANLTQANLAKADLRQAYLNDANLQGANLTNADLSKADLRGANLSNTNLTGVNFAGANLSQANLTGAIVDRDSLNRAALGWTIMPDGSVSNNPALELIATKLNPLKRKAWFPITVRQDGDLTTSKFAGKPWLSENESWIRCGCCDNLMRFFFQLNLEQVPRELQGQFGTGILQFFYCVNCDDYTPFSPSHLVRIVHPQGNPAEYELPNFEDNWSDDSLVRNSDGQFPAKTIVNWKEITDYPDWQDAESAGATLSDEELKILLPESDTEESELEDFNNPNIYEPEHREWNLLLQRSEIAHKVMSKAAMLSYGKDKLAGYPRWVQDPEYPNCPVCDRLMNKLIFEFASDDNVPYLWGDVGTGYFLQCSEHKEQVAFLWQCG